MIYRKIDFFIKNWINSSSKKALYPPVYTTMFIENQPVPEDLIYRVEAI